MEAVYCYGARRNTRFPKFALHFLGKGDGVRVNCRDPDEIAKAISWYSYNLGELVRPSLEEALKDLEMTASDFLRTSDKDFESKFDIFVDAAKEAMRGFKQFNESVGPESTGSSRPVSDSTGYPFTVRYDSNGTKHVYI